MDVEILLEKYMQARRGKWMLEPICKNANDKIVDFLIETAIDDFHDFPDKTDNSTVAIIENLGLSGKKPVAVFLNSILNKPELKRYHTAAKKGCENFSAVTDYTAEDIADITIPDFEMSDRADKTFEFEGSIITVSVSSDLKVLIKDEVGETKEKFDFLHSRILTKYIQDLEDGLEFLSARFSDAIVTNRRWKFSVFEGCVLSHPVMHKFAENLLLAEYNEHNKPKRIFYSFLGGFIDIKNKEKVELNSDAKVGIINSMDISETLLAEIKPKFPAQLRQLSRGIYRPSETEEGHPYVSRFNNFMIDYASFSDSLSAKGYEEGIRENKVYRTLYRANEKLGLAAKIIYSAPEDKRNIKNTRIPKILFYALENLKKKNGKYAADRTPSIPADRVDKYFFSDVLNDIYELIT